MLCPVCNVDLIMSDRSGVEIDYCPKCRGVWLDRGELDKIIERSNGANLNQAPRGHSNYNHYSPQHQESHYKEGYYKKKKRESWLGELFDF